MKVFSQPPPASSVHHMALAEPAAALPGKALESCRLRVNAQRDSTGIELFCNELVHFL